MTSLPQRREPPAETIAAAIDEFRVARGALADLILGTAELRSKFKLESEDLVLSLLALALRESVTAEDVLLLAAVAIYRLSGLEQPR